jgi:Outer membrane protein beta-barrel domain
MALLKKIFVLCCLLVASQQNLRAQRFILNLPDHDQKKYYFGLTFGLNFATYQVSYTSSFVNTDTFTRILPSWSPGFNLGLMGNLKLTKFIDLRLVPSLSFSEKRLDFNKIGYDTIVTKSIESIYVHIPLQLKFKSERIRNFRFYVLLGGKYDYDMAANARSKRNDEYIKVKPNDLGYEFGMGFEFYNPNFIFAPEIKLSQGLMNQIYKDKNIPLTNAIDQLNTRSIVISIHLQG